MIPYLLLITHLTLSHGAVTKVEQSYQKIDEKFTAEDLQWGENNEYICNHIGEQLGDLADDTLAIVWQCVPAKND